MQQQWFDATKSKSFPRSAIADIKKEQEEAKEERADIKKKIEQAQAMMTQSCDERIYVGSFLSPMMKRAKTDAGKSVPTSVSKNDGDTISILPSGSAED